MEKNYQELRNLALAGGISLFGVGNIETLRKSFLLPRELTGDLKYGISLGYRLSDKIIEGIVDKPTKLYLFHYRRINSLLDQVALEVTSFIQKRGWQGLPIPASQVIDWKKQAAHLSHKVVAREAGLGWRGRNNLLINPDFGARVRYATVLTDFPLKADRPVRGNCGECKECLKVCPAGAIKDEAGSFNLNACLEQLKAFSKKENLGVYICGLCLRSCPGKHGKG